MAVETITETGQYLTFKLGEEVFAAEVGQVREILDMSDITKVPKMPDFMKGVINMRGNVVPIVDMCMKFGMPVYEKTVNTCIIVIDVTFNGEEAVLGMLADAVEEVIDLPPEQIEPAPRIGMHLSMDFIKGIGKHEEHFIIILNIDKVFSSSELSEVKEAAG
ncbi:Chemotaxis protein CheW [subsurface metagenome]